MIREAEKDGFLHLCGQFREVWLQRRKTDIRVSG